MLFKKSIYSSPTRFPSQSNATKNLLAGLQPDKATRKKAKAVSSVPLGACIEWSGHGERWEKVD